VVAIPPISKPLAPARRTESDYPLRPKRRGPARGPHERWRSRTCRCFDVPIGELLNVPGPGREAET